MKRHVKGGIGMERIVVCIPAFNPTNALLTVIEQLSEQPFQQIIVVNDGSSTQTNSVFEQIALYDQVTILNHPENLGKGASIKTAIQYILRTSKTIRGVLTCGADGQHHIEDIVKVAKNSRVFVDGIILGTRNFNTEHVPWRFRLQEQTKAIINKVLFQKRLLDFQSGLRFLPYLQLSWIKSCKGEQVDFDTNVLLEALHRKIPIYELPIGKVRITQSSFLHYDEVLYPKISPAKLLRTYLKKRETF